MSTGLADPLDEVAEQTVAEPGKYISVRLSLDVVKDARLAAAFAGKSLSEYISEALRPIAKRDVERGIAERERRSKPPKR